MELISGFFLAFSYRGSSAQVSSSLVCRISCPGQARATVRAEQKAFGGILCLFRGDWSFPWLAFEGAIRVECRELADKRS